MRNNSKLSNIFIYVPGYETRKCCLQRSPVNGFVLSLKTCMPVITIICLESWQLDSAVIPLRFSLINLQDIKSAQGMKCSWILHLEHAIAINVRLPGNQLLAFVLVLVSSTKSAEQEKQAIKERQGTPLSLSAEILVTTTCYAKEYQRNGSQWKVSK